VKQHAVVIETKVLAEFVDLLGPEKVAEALAAMEQSIRSFMGAGPTGGDDIEVLAGAAHKLISTAMIVGFFDLARACRTLEESCGSADAPLAFEHVKAVGEAALEAAADLKLRLLGGQGPGAAGRKSQ
jgi:HPt (histidine-containing phosphotransfer) domain-containing protein